MTDYDTSKEIEKRSKEKRRGKFQIMIVADAEIVEGKILNRASDEQLKDLIASL